MSPQHSKKLYSAGEKVVRSLVDKGYKAFFVGGIVRDNLLKRQSDNVDIATDATPDLVEKILTGKRIYVKPVGKKFGSLLAIVDSFRVEITTFRAEGRYSDNRHPDKIEFIEDFWLDAKRRDFTINALYYDPIKKELFDPAKGQKDLKARLIRFVGDPRKRIDEDALRMMRGVRLATQLGFKMEKNSFAAIKTRAKYIQGISGERIKAELDKILLSKNRGRGLELLDKTGLMRFIIPQMEDMKKFTHQSKKYHLEGNMFNHTLLVLEQTQTQNLELLYALLFHDIGKPFVGKKVRKDEGWVISTKGHGKASADIFMDFSIKLKFSRQSRNTINWIISNHMLQNDFWAMKVSKQLEMANNPSFELLLQHWEADHYGNKRKDDFDQHSINFKKSLKTGRDLVKRLKTSEASIRKLARGEIIMKYTSLKPGEELGRKIEDVKARIVLGKIKNESDLKSYLNTSHPV